MTAVFWDLTARSLVKKYRTIADGELDTSMNSIELSERQKVPT